MALNIPSSGAVSTVNQANRSLTDTTNRISTGLRVLGARDDAAGLGVATGLETTANSTVAAIRNANDGISVIQTAEGSANQVASNLSRMRELAVQAASGTLSDEGRASLQAEFAELNEEITRISENTNFNGVALTDGSASAISAQVGEGSGSDSRIDIGLTNLSASALGTDSASIGTVADARAALDSIDAAIDAVGESRSGLGATQNRLDSAIANNEILVINSTAAASQITDADMALEVSNQARDQILQKASIAALVQTRGMNMSMVGLLS